MVLQASTVAQNAQTQPKSEVHFIGKVWQNVSQSGRSFMRLTIDQSVPGLTLNGKDSLELWPNKKRTGINPRTNKEFNDADFRAIVRIPVNN